MKFPPYMSANAVDIVRKLLDPNPETRLGNHKAGVSEIKEHPFFTKEINFQLLIRQREEAPVSEDLSILINETGLTKFYNSSFNTETLFY